MEQIKEANSKLAQQIEEDAELRKRTEHELESTRAELEKKEHKFEYMLNQAQLQVIINLFYVIAVD